jgi:hypothetical protein
MMHNTIFIKQKRMQHFCLLQTWGAFFSHADKVISKPMTGPLFENHSSPTVVQMFITFHRCSTFFKTVKPKT